LGLKLLVVVAHPDDECFAFGGALALAAEAGIESHVLCLTDGKAASNQGDAASPEELGRMRREELKQSCAVLGVAHCEVLDYEDGQLEFVDFANAAARMVSYMRRFRPNVVITFGVDGGLNTHPDHTIVSALTSVAFQWAAAAKRFTELGPAHRADRLYLLSTSFFMEDRPAPMPLPWTVALNVRAVRARKQEAFRQHTSQAPLMQRTRSLFEEHGDHEFYTLVAQHNPGPAELRTDLFAGLES
jgi:LmbE family N-acetylglucosaminyl deacetylase